MKRLNILILIIALTLISCERDDVCAGGTSTTPRLLIDFYDVTDDEELKTVPRLTVYGDSDDIAVPDDDDDSSAILVEAFETERVYNTNSSSIALPLSIDTEGVLTSTRFVLEQNTNLRLDDDDTTESNIDIIEVTYVSRFEYVSRACGYKSIFTNLDIEIDPDGTDDDIWIENIQIVETTIENEDTAHFYFFH